MSAAGFRSSSRATTIFCWLPPDSRAALVSRRRRADVVGAHERVRLLVETRRRKKDARRERRSAAVAQHQVLGDRHRLDQRRLTAVRRHIGEARVDAFGDGSAREFAAIEPDRARGRGPQACKRLHKFELTVAVDAGDAEDLARAHIERQRTHAPTGEAIDREPYRALPCRTRCMRRRDVATHHHRRELGPRDVADARAVRRRVPAAKRRRDRRRRGLPAACG